MDNKAKRKEPRNMTKAEYAGYRLRSLRGLDKQELIASELKKIGLSISQRRISELERGKARMTAQELEVFCDLFEVEPNYFFKPTEDKPIELPPKETEGEVIMTLRFKGTSDEYAEKIRNVFGDSIVKEKTVEKREKKGKEKPA